MRHAAGNSALWWRRIYSERLTAARRAGLFHRRAQKAEGEVASLRRQLAHVGREWSAAVRERNNNGRSLVTLGGILEALAERLTPEEAAAVASEMARAPRAGGGLLGEYWKKAGGGHGG